MRGSHRRETVLVQKVWQELLRVRLLEETQEKSQLVKFHERTHTGEKAIPVHQMWQYVIFIHQINWKKLKRNHTVGKLRVHKVWHELLSIRWLNEKWENHTGDKQFLCTKCARGSHGYMTWSNMREPTASIWVHTQKKMCSSAPNVTIASSFQKSDYLKRYRKTLNWWSFMRGPI